ncbi:MAG: hypothetical protein AAGD47_00950 [Pseudomonadota bacterium]
MTLIASSLFAHGALSSEPVCENMNLASPTNTRSVEFKDVDGSGSDSRTTGDMHIGSRLLLNQNGDEVGIARWISVSHGPNVTLSTVVFEFGSGQLFATTLYDSGGTANVKTYGVIGKLEGAITGGTGEFLNARGRYELVTDSDDHRYIIEVNCDR